MTFMETRARVEQLEEHLHIYQYLRNFIENGMTVDGSRFLGGNGTLISVQTLNDVLKEIDELEQKTIDEIAELCRT